MMKGKKVDVCVLMSTYNGEKYLREQIDSILGQEGVDVRLLVRDDGSKDGTLQILKEYKNKGLLEFYTGQNLGAAHSFLQLLKNAPECSYYAFSDQDDVWLKDKLSSGIDQLQNYDEIPAFYNSMTTVVDERLKPTGETFGCKKIYNFVTQVARSNVIGCTMIINQKLVELVKMYYPENILMHDQWIAIICKAFNGLEIKDNSSKILYRQHGNNVVGSKTHVIDKLKTSAMTDNSNCRLKQAVELYKGYYNLIDNLTKKELYDFVNYKKRLYCRLKCVENKYNAERETFNKMIRMSFIFNRF